MPIDPNNFEEMMELLDHKMVRTSNGSYISIEDLRSLVKETAEMRKEERKEMPHHKSMHAARKAALADKELRAMFEPSPAPSVDIANRALVKERQAQSASSA